MTKDKLVDKIKELLKTDLNLDFLLELKRKRSRSWLRVSGIGWVRGVGK